MINAQKPQSRQHKNHKMSASNNGTKVSSNMLIKHKRLQPKKSLGKKRVLGEGHQARTKASNVFVKTF